MRCIVILYLCLLLTISAIAEPAQTESAETLMTRARELLGMERYSEAAEKLEQAAAANPRLPFVHYYRGLAYWRLRQVETAERAFQTALQVDPGDLYSRYYLGRISLLTGDLQSAISHLEQVVQSTDPETRDAYQQLGRAYLKLGNPEKAIEFLREAVEQDPRDARIRDGLAAAYRAAGLHEEARAEIERAARLRNSDLDEAQLLQTTHEALASGDDARIRAVHERALEKASPEQLVTVGNVFAEKQQYTQALELFEKALTLDDLNFEAAFNAGYTHFNLEQYASAEIELDRAARFRPDSFEAHFLLGLTRTHLGRNLPAIRAFRRAVELQPENLKIRTLLSLQLIEGRYYLEAIRVVSETLALDDSDQNVWFLLIQAYHLNQDYEKSLQTAQQALRRYGQNPRASYEVGFQLANMGRFEEAKPYFERTLHMDPRYGAAHYWLGDLALKGGGVDEAILHFRQAIALDDNFLDAYLGLAKALLLKEEYDEVVRLMRRATVLDLEDPQPHLHLARAYQALGLQEKAGQETQLFNRLNQERAKRRDQEVPRELPPDR